MQLRLVCLLPVQALSLGVLLSALPKPCGFFGLAALFSAAPGGAGGVCLPAAVAVRVAAGMVTTGGLVPALVLHLLEGRARCRFVAVEQALGQLPDEQLQQQLALQPAQLPAPVRPQPA